MGGIIEDIFEDIEIKPKKSKLVIRWIVRISIFLITTAFIIGKFTIMHQNRLKNIETTIEKNKTEIEKNKKDINKMNEKMECNFDRINNRIDLILFHDCENKGI